MNPQKENMKNSKKIIFIVFLLLLVLSPIRGGNVQINAAEKNTRVCYGGTTSRYWTQKGSKWLYTKSGTKYKMKEMYMQSGFTYGLGTVKTKGSISTGISVGRVVVASVSYTPGSTSSFSFSAYKAPGTGTYAVYATPKELVYEVYQEYRQTDGCTYDKLLSKKTGTQSIPTTPEISFVKLGK